MSYPPQSDPRTAGTDILKYQQQREAEAVLFKFQVANQLIGLVEVGILTIDEARAVLGYEPRPTVAVTLTNNWTSTAVRATDVNVTQFGGSK